MATIPALIMRRATERPGFFMSCVPTWCAWGQQNVSWYVHKHGVRDVMVCRDGLRIGTEQGRKIPWSRWCANRLLELGISEIRCDRSARPISETIVAASQIRRAGELSTHLSDSAVIVDFSIEGARALLNHPLVTDEDLLAIVRQRDHLGNATFNVCRAAAYRRIVHKESTKLETFGNSVLLAIFDEIDPAKHEELANLLLDRAEKAKGPNGWTWIENSLLQLIEKLGKTTDPRFAQMIKEYKDFIRNNRRESVQEEAYLTSD